MCGIAGLYLRDESLDVDTDALLSTLFDAIDHRGGDACGFVAIGEDGVMEWQKASCDARHFNLYRRKVPRGTRIVLAHTRWATQGLPAFMENNHPIRRGAFFIIHNGHVLNDSEMFRDCRKYRYGDVDSEAIAARLSAEGTLDGLPRIMSSVRGQAAVAAIDERCPDTLALARGSTSPLWVLETRRIVLFASTKAAVILAHRRHIGTIDDKRAVEMKEGTFALYQGDTFRTEEFDYDRYKPLVTKYGDKHDHETTPHVTICRWDPKDDECCEGDVCQAGLTDDEDELWCDGCGDDVSWKHATYVQGMSSSETFVLCPRCDDEGRKPYEDEFSFVNRQVLKALNA